MGIVMGIVTDSIRDEQDAVIAELEVAGVPLRWTSHKRPRLILEIELTRRRRVTTAKANGVEIDSWLADRALNRGLGTILR